MNKKIWEIENKSKLITKIDYLYKKVLFSNIFVIISNFNGIPIEAEDLYYEFLYEISDLTKKFQGKDEKAFLSYLVVKAKMFARNKIKHYCGNNFKVMNSYVPFDYETIEFRDRNNEEEITIDLSSLTDAEFLLYKLKFLEGKNPKEIAQITMFSPYSQKKLLEKLKKKIKTQLEN